MVRAIRIAIADDHPIVLCGLHKALEGAGFEVLSAEATPSGLLTLLESTPCDVVITDYCMPGDESLDGWRFLASVSSAFPDVPLLIFTEFDDAFLIGCLAQRGIAGIVSKREDMSEVFAAVRCLANGIRYLSPVARGAIERFGEHPDSRRFTALSRRQMEVAGLMLCGLSVSETARLLDRRINTISSQRIEACKRLGFAGESDLYRFAYGHGISLERSSRELGADPSAASVSEGVEREPMNAAHPACN